MDPTYLALSSLRVPMTMPCATHSSGPAPVGLTHRSAPFEYSQYSQPPMSAPSAARDDKRGGARRRRRHRRRHGECTCARARVCVRVCCRVGVMGAGDGRVPWDGVLWDGMPWGAGLHGHAREEAARVAVRVDRGDLRHRMQRRSERRHKQRSAPPAPMRSRLTTAAALRPVCASAPSV